MAAKENDPVGSRLEWAVQIAREAGDGTLRYFRRADLRVERKADDSPVTVADREAEQLLRKRIAERFPDDGDFGRGIWHDGRHVGFSVGARSDRWDEVVHSWRAVVHDAGGGAGGARARSEEQVGRISILDPRSSTLIGVIDAPATGETVYAATGAGAGT